MKVHRWLNLLLIAAFLTACSVGGEGGVPSIFGDPSTPTPLPPPQPTIIHAPDAQAAIAAYLEAFKANDFATMYSMLTRASQDAITPEDFATVHNDALNTMSASSLDFETISSLVSPYAAEVAYRLTYHTVLVGDIQRDIVVRLALDNDQWKVEWHHGLILPELAGGNVLSMDYQIPARGNIYDRDGQPIVAQAEAYAFGVIPQQINQETFGTLVSELANLCGFIREDIEATILSAGPDWYLPMCEGTREEADHLLAVYPGGLVVNGYQSRYYFDQGLASQVVGYTQLIDQEELDEYRRLGYQGTERVGQTGIELWAEDYLAGEHGGSLYVINPTTNQIVTRLGESAPQPADSVYLTLDKNLQFYAEQVIQEFTGGAAIVVLERDTGRVLAMASAPGFNANFFDPENVNSPNGLADLLSSTNDPLLNRAAQGQYPLGSVFKIITMAAALESGLYLAETTYDCQYDFTELSDQVRHDWTWQHCQDRIRAGQFCETSDSTPSGNLTLQEGLMRSCNPYFWHIGNDLYSNWSRGSDIANMAREFGLGSPTGIEQIPEEAGVIQDPTDAVAAVNQSIGQGDVLVTPLQVARFIAAIGNGGTLYRPQLVERIQPIEGDPVYVFKPEAQDTLPLRKENLEIIQEAMQWVVDDPRGTANFRLRGLSIPVAGKTGTAETALGIPHAWFAGYTLNSESSGQPDIAIAVIVENIGEGSDYAAPIFQRLVQVYYNGSPTSILWFESTYGVLKTPTPIGGVPTRTPKP
ncbi:MAG: penicillin-binding transpeptidase domain-containing protein [Chloroflexota bacterium]